MLLYGRDIEPAGNLLGDPDREAVAGGLKQAPALDFVLERLALDLGALEDRVGMAESVGQCTVREIVEAGCGRRIRSLGHGVLHRLGLGLPR